MLWRTIFVIGALAIALGSAPAAWSADFGPPEPVTIEGYSGTAQNPWVTSDGQYLLFDAMPAPWGSKDPNIPRCARQIDYKKFLYIGEIAGIAAGGAGAASATDDVGDIYFLTSRYVKSQTPASIAHGRFADCTVTEIHPVEGILPPFGYNMSASPSRDGQFLVFSDNVGEWSSLAIAQRNADGSFSRLGNSADLMRNANDRARFGIVYSPTLSADGLTLLFNGPPHIYAMRRPATTEAFGVAEALNTGGLDSGKSGLSEVGSLSRSGDLVYYHQLISPNFAAIYVLTRQ